MPTNHTWANFFEPSYATPVAIVAVLLLTASILRKFCSGVWEWIVLSEPEEAKDENLPNFYRTVKLMDADWIISENEYYERNYGMKAVSKELTNKLDSNSIVTKPIQGIAWYNVCANSEYI